jgi:hypothetical protein
MTSKTNSASGLTSESTCADIVWCTTTSSGTFGRQKQRSVKSKFNIERFAEQNGLAVTIRDTGINATFKKKAAPHEQVKPDLKTLPDSKSRMQVSAQQDSRKITSFRRPDFNAHV